MKQEKNILTQGLKQNDGLAIQQLIEQNLKNARFCFLAKIISINNNKVSVIEIARQNQKEKNPILNNVLVAQPKSGEWEINFNLKVGDIGLCLVCDYDLSIYKNQGSNNFMISTDRRHDLNDCIFLPLSLYTQNKNNNIDFIIQDKSGNNIINFKGGNLDIKSEKIATLEAQLITIKSQQTTLKQVLANLANVLTSSNTQTASNHTHATFDNTAKSALNAWVNSLDTLFKE